ncbi:YczE/YyaS/YitT family protein [Corynebacterium nasicanis]|uniref:YitT family protein n=1 Tax=Corynebacterium nasicanis TaxID=1448267 RepID=A0ABW1QEI1_9CORY
MALLAPRRLFLLFVGLVIMALGIALSVRSDLGTTTISSPPYVLSIISPLSLGMASILVNSSLVLLQFLILRRRFHPLQLLQIPVLLLFGVLNDIALWATSWVTYTAYWQQWALVLLGIVVLAVGIIFQIAGKSIMLAGEATVLTIATELARVFGERRLFVFGYVKIAFDIILVLSAVALGLAFAGQVVGVREGTVAAALLIGFFVKRLQPVLGPPLERFRR